MSDKSAAVHIAQMLEESALGYTIDVDLFISKEPGKTNNTVTVYDTGAGKPDNVLGQAKQRYENLMVQVLVRNESYRTAWNNMYSIIDHLDYRTGDVVDGLTYTSIILFSGPGHVDYDERNRCRISANFRITRY